MSEEVQGLKDLVQRLQTENDRLRREQTSAQPSKSDSTARTDGRLSNTATERCIYPEKGNVQFFGEHLVLGLRNG